MPTVGVAVDAVGNIESVAVAKPFQGKACKMGIR
jgi:hypothetical protein